MCMRPEKVIGPKLGLLELEETLDLAVIPGVGCGARYYGAVDECQWRGDHTLAMDGTGLVTF
jgi:hypothetical protein